MRDYAAWAIAAEDRGEAIARARSIPVWSLVTPVLPLILYVFAGANALIAFGLSALYGALTVQPRRSIKILVSSAIRGVEDVAPAVLLMMGIGMLLAAAKLPPVPASLSGLRVTPLRAWSWKTTGWRRG